MDSFKYAMSLIGVGVALVAFAFSNFATKGEIVSVSEKLNSFATKRELEIVHKKLDIIDKRLFQILNIIRKND